MDSKFIIFMNLENVRVKALSNACLDRAYDCPSEVDQQQLNDLHIVINQ